MSSAACVYTALTGRYEPLGEQPVARTSALPFICFTDDPTLTSETWQIRPLAPLFAADPIRNQRDFKFHPHRHLPEFRTSLYIDNTIRLTAPPEDLFAVADLSTGLCLPEHSFRDTLLGEFVAVLEDNLDDPARVRELLDQVSLEAPHLLSSKPYWSGLMMRDHHNPRVAHAMEIWFAHVLRHSRRDQLSGPLAFHRAGLTPTTLAIDNHVSAFHTWPHLEGRDAARRLWTVSEDHARLTAHLRILEQQTTSLRAENDRLRVFEQQTAVLWAENARLDHVLTERTHHLEVVLASTTWRAFAPVRALAGLLRRRA